MEIKIYSKNSTVIEKASEGASGYDIKAYLKDDIVLKPQQRVLVPTGIFLEMPIGVEAQVRSRSGLALKKGVIVLNSPGTVDADYRGEVGVILYNTGSEDFVIKNGERIAQIVFASCLNVTLKEIFDIKDLAISERDSKGFGSTGV